MKKFMYYRIFDEVKEPIDFGNFVDEQEAITFFAKRKNLPINEFLNLFKVSRWNFKTDITKK